MGLNDLIKGLDSSIKTALLGSEITKILRYTFVKNDHYAIDENIVNEALAIQKGVELVRSKKDLLIESCRFSQIKALGFSDYDEAIKFYKKNTSKFIKDFNIEKEYLIVPKEDVRSNYELKIPIYGECNGVNAFPHDYQQRLKTVILEKLFNNLNPTILASMPTGAGKTVLAMEIIVDLFRSYEGNKSKAIKILWVVNSKELSEQSLKSFQKIWNQKGDHAVVTERYFGKFNSIYFGPESKISFATFDLLVSRKGTPEVKRLLRETDFLFIDEAHSSDATTYNDVIQMYKNSNTNFKALGLTATPYRSDDNEFMSLKNLFSDYIILTDEDNNQIESPLQYLIEEEYLSKVSFEILDISEGNISNSEFYGTLHHSILNECNELLRKNENTIIFARSKAHAVALSIFLRRNNIENGLIVGETPEVKREEFLRDFGDKKNDLSVLVNHQILSTGIDVPGMNSIMILSDINSPTLALQVLGRAMRGPKNGGNKQNTIYLTPSNQKKLMNYRILESIVLNK